MFKSMSLICAITSVVLLTACGGATKSLPANEAGHQPTPVVKGTPFDKMPDEVKAVQIGLALNHKTGNYGVAIAPLTMKSDSVFQMALLSCVGKDLGEPFDLLVGDEQLQVYAKALQSGQSKCKVANVSHLGYTPKALALFRNRLNNGNYNFHGAFSSHIDVPHSEFKKQFDDCKKESANCKHIQTFSFKTWALQAQRNNGLSIF